MNFFYVSEVLNKIFFGNANFSWKIVSATNKNDYYKFFLKTITFVEKKQKLL